MKILAIGRYYPPSAFSEALCAARFVLALAQNGAKVTYLTIAGNEPKHEEDANLFKHPSVRVFRVPGIASHDPRRPFAYVHSWLSIGATLEGSFFADRINRMVPRLLREGPFDLLYSRARPASALYAACVAAEITGLPWVSHLNEPWPAFLYPEPYRSRYRSRRRARLEDKWKRRMLNRALACAVENATLAAHLARHDQGYARARFLIVPNVILKRDIEGRGFRETSAERPWLQLIHAGILDVARDPAPFLTALHRVANDEGLPIKALFVGHSSEQLPRLVEEMGLADRVTCAGHVSHQEVTAAVRASDVALVIEADMDTGVFVPGKFIDYVASCRPILALTPRGGAIEGMLSKGGGIPVSPSDVEAIAAALRRLHGLWRSNRLEELSSRRLVPEFDAERVAGDFLSEVAGFLNQRVGGRTKPAGAR
jgi:glycosyltransferase involved in cell wall biosynthesis